MLTQVREFFLDAESGEKRPGKKGLALDPSQLDDLVEAAADISKAVGPAAAAAGGAGGGKAVAAAAPGTSKPKAGGLMMFLLLAALILTMGGSSLHSQQCIIVCHQTHAQS
jgi:hypothetical protein